jgi:hypothetical protein
LQNHYKFLKYVGIHGDNFFGCFLSGFRTEAQKKESQI